MSQMLNKLATKSSLKLVFSVTATRPCIAPFHTSSQSFSKPKRVEKSFKTFPQPILRPIGPEDYKRWQYFLNQPKPKPYIQPHTSKDVAVSNEIISRVNEQICNGNHGRLFAVVQVASKQFKVTTDDIIVVQGYFEPELAAVIRLEKVLLVGGSDFTIIGRPLLERNFVNIEATVIERTLSPIITHFHMIPRKRHRRTKFTRIPLTMMRINHITIDDTIQ